MFRQIYERIRERTDDLYPIHMGQLLGTIIIIGISTLTLISFRHLLQEINTTRSTPSFAQTLSHYLPWVNLWLALALCLNLVKFGLTVGRSRNFDWLWATYKADKWMNILGLLLVLLLLVGPVIGLGIY